MLQSFGSYWCDPQIHSQALDWHPGVQLKRQRRDHMNEGVSRSWWGKPLSYGNRVYPCWAPIPPRSTWVVTYFWRSFHYNELLRFRVLVNQTYKWPFLIFLTGKDTLSILLSSGNSRKPLNRERLWHISQLQKVLAMWQINKYCWARIILSFISTRAIDWFEICFIYLMKQISGTLWCILLVNPKMIIFDRCLRTSFRL